MKARLHTVARKYVLDKKLWPLSKLENLDEIDKFLDAYT
jgi:hypothetical protein